MKPHIHLISAYSRAHWMSRELISLGYEVTLWDCSSQLKNTSPEFWESPFGVFKTQNLCDSQLHWLSLGNPMKEMEKGFVVSLPDGPIEFRGPLKNFSLQVRNLNFDHKSGQPRDFKSSWIVHLAHHLASNKYCFSSEALKLKSPLPLNSSWVRRSMTRRTYELDLQECRDAGVQVHNHFAGFEKQENDLILIFLTSQEMDLVEPEFFKGLYEEPIIPDWYWTRCRVQVEKTAQYEALPLGFCMIQDPFLSWTHENLLVIYKSEYGAELNVWAKIPYHYREHEDEIQVLEQKILKIFTNRFSLIPIKNISWPMEENDISSAPIFPIYNLEKHEKQKKDNRDMFLLCGPEEWDRLDWEWVLNYQSQWLQKIESFNTVEKVRRRGRDSEIYS